jgi:hypothetical protein
MNEDEDWVMRPALEGICRYESLVDGTLDLSDVARMNEALDVRNENQARVEDAMRDRH